MKYMRQYMKKYFDKLCMYSFQLKNIYKTAYISEHYSNSYT
jgi:hypothetical protein